MSNGFLQSQSNFAEGSSHSGLSKCDSRQPVMEGQHHTREWSLHPKISDDLPNLAQINGIHVCNKNEQQATSVHFSSPRPNGMAVDTLNISKEALDGCLLSNSSHPKSSTKHESLCLSNNSSSPRVTRDELFW